MLAPAPEIVSRERLVTPPAAKPTVKALIVLDKLPSLSRWRLDGKTPDLVANLYIAEVDAGYF